jgi:hypothetical protein
LSAEARATGRAVQVKRAGERAADLRPMIRDYNKVVSIRSAQSHERRASAASQRHVVDDIGQPPRSHGCWSDSSDDDPRRGGRVRSLSLLSATIPGPLFANATFKNALKPIGGASRQLADARERTPRPPLARRIPSSQKARVLVRSADRAPAPDAQRRRACQKAVRGRSGAAPPPQSRLRRLTHQTEGRQPSVPSKPREPAITAPKRTSRLHPARPVTPSKFYTTQVVCSVTTTLGFLLMSAAGNELWFIAATASCVRFVTLNLCMIRRACNLTVDSDKLSRLAITLLE